MAYHFEPHEELAAGTQRIAQELLVDSLKEIGNPTCDRSEVVHDVRVACKMLRGLLRLIRPGIPVETYRAENARFRDLARRLAEQRDRDVALGLLRSISQTSNDPELEREAEETAGLISAAPGSAESGASSEQLEQAALELTKALAAIDSWPLDNLSRRAVAKGFRRTYSQGYKFLQSQLSDPSDAGLHELRKFVKYHWYHVRLLRKVAPRKIRQRRQAARRLGQQLGYLHDLVVLSELLESLPASSPGTVTGEATCTPAGLRAWVDRELSQQRAESLKRLKKFYKPSPDRLYRKLCKRWCT